MILTICHKYNKSFIENIPKVTHQYFSMQNQYNQAITKFAVKSNIQDIHKPQQY